MSFFWWFSPGWGNHSTTTTTFTPITTSTTTSTTTPIPTTTTTTTEAPTTGSSLSPGALRAAIGVAVVTGALFLVLIIICILLCFQAYRERKRRAQRASAARRRRRNHFTYGIPLYPTTDTAAAVELSDNEERDANVQVTEWENIPEAEGRQRFIRGFNFDGAENDNAEATTMNGEGNGAARVNADEGSGRNNAVVEGAAVEPNPFAVASSATMTQRMVAAQRADGIRRAAQKKKKKGTKEEMREICVGVVVPELAVRDQLRWVVDGHVYTQQWYGSASYYQRAAVPSSGMSQHDSIFVESFE